MIQEAVYVLETEYDLGAVDITTKLISLLAIQNVGAPDAGQLIEALQYYRARNCDFGDVLLCSFAQAEGLGVSTFDKGIMKKFPELSVHTPNDWLTGKADGKLNGHQN